MNGIYFYAPMRIENNNIYTNTIYLNNQCGIYLYAYNNRRSYIQNNNISSNVINQHNNDYGIYIIAENVSGIWQTSYLYDNTITSNLIGIKFLRINSHDVKNNYISNNEKDGILLDISTYNTLTYNTISENNWTGINLISSSSDSIIENNNINSNNQNGIFITDSSNNALIYSNEISSNSDTGLKIIDSTGCQIHHNNFKSNTQNAYDSTIALNDWDDGSKGNYWSDYTGFDDDNDGFGEDPYVIPGGGSRDWHPFMNPLNIIPDPSSFEIPLSVGWNLISLPLIQSDTSISAVLGSIAGNYDRVELYDANDNKWHTTDDDLTDLDHTMGFWIHMKISDTLVVTGTIPDTTLISLYQGWNLVGNPSSSEQPIDVTLDSIAGKYTSVQSYDSFDITDHWKDYNIYKPQNLNDLTYMTRGCGYWIYVTENCIWGINNS
ncbi:MAG: right-handed parallel beta-helix repeat-containing protein [Thermoplasmata archaeon]|nr:MAG: right-handed parallel beta-helix repeat-containing protein [Thermoplasmata archaeon]